jgi:hypothetical protein
MLDDENMLHAIPPNGGRKVWPRDWLANQEDDGKGVRCMKCHCRHFEVRNTVPAAGGVIKRYRVCRNCGTVRTTYER